jgi:DNA repair photolyase
LSGSQCGGRRDVRCPSIHYLPQESSRCTVGANAICGSANAGDNQDAEGRCPLTTDPQPSLFDEWQPQKTATVEGAVVREVASKSLLNRSGINDYSFNCYTGCTHACVYCYARFMQRFHPHDEPWGQFVDVKVNAAEVLARQVRRMPPGSVFTCSACDGWQSVERDYELTRRCCKILLDAGFSLTILTKSDLILRDLDILAGRPVRVGVTITTSEPAQAALWEPKASAVPRRLEILRQAKAAGLKTTMMFGPLLPAISDTPEGLEKLFELAGQVDVDSIWTDALNPRPRVWPAIQALLRRCRPDLLGHYGAMLFDAVVRARYEGDLKERVRQVAVKAGLADRLG